MALPLIHSEYKKTWAKAKCKQLNTNQKYYEELS